MRVYTVTLYHDEPGEAVVDARAGRDRWATEKAARTGAKRQLTGYWNSATVEVGTLIPANHPHYPERIEHDHTTRHIGPDWDDPA